MKKTEHQNDNEKRDKGVEEKTTRIDREQNKKPFAPRGMTMWIFILGVICILLFFRSAPGSKIEQLTYTRFVELLDNNQLTEGEIIYNPQAPELKEVRGKYVSSKGDTSANETKTKDFVISAPLNDDVREKLLQSGFKMVEADMFMQNLIWGILPFLLIALFIYFLLMRQIRGVNKGATTFGKSRARMLDKDKNKIKFADVAGIDEAIEEVQELVDYLKDRKKFQQLGGKIPRGVLMVGAPGTGKTLLAKAIAGEADADFFSISGSDFVEMFVGVGASRVRDMFAQARSHTPCLIFIDEIDAVGRSRGVGLGGGNDEREQTLNALLVEMDGFEEREDIIVIAATNRPDVLDPALLRPGRFDRQVTVNLPDVKGREAILNIHAKKVKLADDVDLQIIARGTPGYSGAELANVLNEAALLAAREGKDTVSMAELEEARDKVRWGSERRSMAMTDVEKATTAWHESGHALLNLLLEHTDPLHKVTIIPRGQALGATMSLPKEDVRNRTLKQMQAMICLAMGGRIAEELYTGDISTGAAGDISMATNLARSMVCQWGMSEKLGAVLYGSDSEYILLGRDMARGKEYSDETAHDIDVEVKRIVHDEYDRAKKLIFDNKDKLKLIAESLIEKETLTGSQIRAIVGIDVPSQLELDLDDVQKKVEEAVKELESEEPPPFTQNNNNK